MDRSENMSRIRGKDTSPEVFLRRSLWAQGLRYRKHLRILGARPDLAFVGHRLAVFVDGCFWHGCPEHYVRPRGPNHQFWAMKLRTNTDRDARQTLMLEGAGWTVIRIWEHELVHGASRAVQTIVDDILDYPRVAAEHWAAIAAEPGITADVDQFTLRELRSGKLQTIQRPRVASLARSTTTRDIV